MTLSGVAARSLPSRWGSALVLMIGMAGVAGVTTALFSMAVGFEKTFTEVSNPLRAVVVNKQSNNDSGSSQISREQLVPILSAPGIARDANGDQLASIEKYILSNVEDADTGEYKNQVIRGVSANVFAVRPEAQLIEGHLFETGKREAVVGVSVARRYPQFALGQTAEVGGEDWTVVGVFDMAGSSYESEIWADTDTVLAAYSQTGLLTGVSLLLESPESIVALEQSIADNASLEHKVLLESTMNADLAQPMITPLRMLGGFIGVLMGLGVLFSAVSTASTVIARRLREIVTLRAIGYGSGAAAGSVLIEVTLLSALGGLLGALLAYAVFNGYSASTMSFSTFSQVGFNFAVTPTMIGLATALCAAIGLLGAAVPAIRAGRATIASALSAGP